MSLMQRAVSRRRCDAVVRWALAASALSLGNSPLQAQSASLVYRLGTDTVAVEQFTRTARALTGDMVQRSGAAVVRYHYELTLGATGQPIAARIQRQTPTGAPAPAPSETRFTLFADSVVREVVYADSVQRRVFAVCAGLGLALYLGHLSHRVFRDSLWFPLALTLIGLGVMAAGILWQRHEARLRVALLARLPAALRKWVRG